jgi:hypothetical protein
VMQGGMGERGGGGWGAFAGESASADGLPASADRTLPGQSCGQRRQRATAGGAGCEAPKLRIKRM